MGTAIRFGWTSKRLVPSCGHDFSTLADTNSPLLFFFFLPSEPAETSNRKRPNGPRKKRPAKAAETTRPSPRKQPRADSSEPRLALPRRLLRGRFRLRRRPRRSSPSRAERLGIIPAIPHRITGGLVLALATTTSVSTLCLGLSNRTTN